MTKWALPSDCAPIEQFAHNLTRCRVQSKLKKREVAARANIDPSHLTHLERGDREPQLDTIVKLAGALSVELEELFLGIAWRPVTEHRPGGFYVNDSGKGG